MRGRKHSGPVFFSGTCGNFAGGRQMGVKQDVRYAFVLLSFSDGTFIFVSETIENAEAEDEYGYVSRESGRPVARIRRIRLLFSGLLEVTHTRAVDDGLGERIEEYVMSWLETMRWTGSMTIPPTATVVPISDALPKRGGGHRDELAGGNRTSIHAHPQFAGYFSRTGDFSSKFFCAGRSGIRPPAAFGRRGGAARFLCRRCGRSFENHIHRITCLSPTGHSLHVYSDDALRGRYIGNNAIGRQGAVAVRQRCVVVEVRLYRDREARSGSRAAEDEKAKGSIR